ncbi:MAG: acetyl-CoA carboxylase biotin carboxyl carrier protein [Acidobacteriota bacterium]
MTIQEIKELLELFNSTDVAELEVQRGENRVRFRRAGMEVNPVLLPVATPAFAAAEPAAPQHNIAAASTAPPSAPPIEDAKNLVTSPIVGTYYDAPSPGAPPFVKVGDAVEPGQVLCIIESMKLMNEIEAEIAGTITAKLMENGRPVEYGEALFSVKPR